MSAQSNLVGFFFFAIIRVIRPFPHLTMFLTDAHDDLACGLR